MVELPLNLTLVSVLCLSRSSPKRDCRARIASTPKYSLIIYAVWSFFLLGARMEAVLNICILFPGPKRTSPVAKQPFNFGSNINEDQPFMATLHHKRFSIIGLRSLFIKTFSEFWRNENIPLHQDHPAVQPHVNQ